MAVGFSLLEYESSIRLGCFLLIFLLIALCEWRFPRSPLTLSRSFRWRHNLALLFCNTLLLRLIFPTSMVGVALYAEQQGWGLLNQWSMNPWLAGIVALVALDGVVYWQHRLFHRWSWLWCLHRVHHTDLDYDLTTALRFHPLEIVISMVVKGAAIALLGVSPLVAALFEIVLNGSALFNHGNFRIPPMVDRWLRWGVVTPDMHRVHHSTVRVEQDSNFGFCLSWWDRLFASYCERPKAGIEGMTIGVEELRSPQRSNRLAAMLLQPFRSDRS